MLILMDKVTRQFWSDRQLNMCWQYHSETNYVGSSSTIGIYIYVAIHLKTLSDGNC